MVAAINDQAYTIASKNKARGEIIINKFVWPADCWMVGVFMEPGRYQNIDGTLIEMGITRSLGICGVLLESPVNIIFRSFQNELEEQLESVKTSAR